MKIPVKIWKPAATPRICGIRYHGGPGEILMSAATPRIRGIKISGGMSDFQMQGIAVSW